MAIKVAIRTDASVLIGSGHVMRCLALAAGLAEQGAEVRFICREHTGHACDDIASRGFPLTRLPGSIGTLPQAGYAGWLGVTPEADADETAVVLQNDGPWDWLIVDHYALAKSWEARVQKTVDRICVIDDLANRDHHCDTLLDQSGVVTGVSRYTNLVPPECLLLEGPRYAQLRREFQAAGAAVREFGAVRRLFIFFGGSDLDNHTDKALQAVLLAELPKVTVDVVVGTTNPHGHALQERYAELPYVRFHSQVNNMAILMRTADLAIGAGGVTLWERCHLGLPSIVVSCADNQVSACEYAAEQGAIFYLGAAETVRVTQLAQSLAALAAAPLLRKHMCSVGQSLVDGQGVARVVKALLSRRDIVLRRATMSDCDAILDWRNAEPTRRFSNHSEPIEARQHAEWFSRMLRDPDQEVLIGEQDSHAVGVLRFDRNGKSAVVSLFLVPGLAGQGLGRQMLLRSREWLRTHWPEVEILEAQIKMANTASVRTFAAAGFVQDTGLFQLQL